MIPFKTRIKSGVVQRLEVIESLSFQGQELTPGAATDEKAKISANDTTAGYLNGKLVAGSGIVLTENNNGGNETLTISANAVDLDVKVSVSANDTTAGYLNGKLVAGTGIVFTENNNGGDETLTLTLGSHTHAASDITSGIIATARLATGTADSTTFLRGDQTWQTIASGVTGFTPSQNTAAPNATVNASRLLVNVATTNGDIVLQPKGTGSLLAQLPDSTTTGGNKRGTNAVDLQTVRNSATQVASGQYSAIGGGANNVASGIYSTATGGNSNSAQGAQVFVGGGVSNTANGTSSFVGGGQSNGAYASWSVVAGGNQNSVQSGSDASGILSGNFNWVGPNSIYAAIVGGQYNYIGDGSSVNNYACTVGGYYNWNYAPYGFMGGGQRNTVGHNNPGPNSTGGVIIGGEWAFTNRRYQRSFAAGRFASIGDAQTEWYDVRRVVTTSSWAALTADGSTPDNFSNTIRIMPSSVYTFEALISAVDGNGTSTAAGYKIEGMITNLGGTVALLGTPVVTTFGETLSGMDVRAVADTTNGALSIEFAGSSGYAMRVHAHVTLVKSSFA